jgi:hypothetical protein
MNAKWYYIQLATLCLVLIALCAFGIASYFWTGLLRGSLDGILLVVICAVIGLTFGIQIVSIIRTAQWLRRTEVTKTSSEAKVASASGHNSLKRPTDNVASHYIK